MKPFPRHIGEVYFIGIGGIGMSALARYFHRRGVRVSGYDRDQSELVQELINEGIDVHFNESTDSIPASPDLVVYTPAIPVDHAELQYYRRSDVTVLKRAEVLGVLSRQMRCIAVAGTHGKTTTSVLTAYLLRKSGVDCTAFLGGISVDFDGNLVIGDSAWMVAEADEFDRSFLQLTPEVAVVTSTDPDHLDVYGTLLEMRASFRAFVRCIKPGGVLIIHDSVWETLMDDSLLDFLRNSEIGQVRYGKSIDADFRAVNVRSEDIMRFHLLMEGATLDVGLSMTGLHNVHNAVAAIAACVQVKRRTGISIANGVRLDALREFKGIKRRFETVFENDHLIVIDDYAHHPKELEAAIDAARKKFPGREITGVFQPHLYSRTRDFYEEFAEALNALDICVLTDIYPAREQPITGIASGLIYDRLTLEKKYNVAKARLIETLESIRPEILLLLGAGDLDRMIPQIIERLTN